MISYVLGVVTGLLPIPAAVLSLAGVERLRRGSWLDLDPKGCDACQWVPDDQWSPVHRCPRCGRRQVRSWLYRLAGRPVLERRIACGSRDEAWLNGETQ